MSLSILFVLTSADTTLRGGTTGWFLPEAAHPYYVLAPHASIDFAAPKGPNPPLDPLSIEMFKEDEESIKFLQDPIAKDKLANAKVLADVKASDYDAIFYAGGHGPVIDLPTLPENIKLASEFFQSGKITSAVCHGPAALVGVNDSSGVSIFKGKTFTGFSNAEDVLMGKVEDIPFLLEDKISELGGNYVKAEPWQPKVVVVGNLITGQNPASARGVGEAVLKALQK
ncbi:class I glutamine amidotransferase-like protein [Flagelloscypha sp. PMI_526]|nr:class I glutamine amidotransferase-like protein [Flagelloscypha sp. PMI_526]